MHAIKQNQSINPESWNNVQFRDLET